MAQDPLDDGGLLDAGDQAQTASRAGLIHEPLRGPESEATRFAREWVAAWNSHDLERILSHYADDAELTSPLVQKILGDDLGSG